MQAPLLSDTCLPRPCVLACLPACLQDAGVAAYFAGHDHDLQHNVKLSDPGDDSSDPVWPHHVVSGAGSETRKNEKKSYKGKVGERDTARTRQLRMTSLVSSMCVTYSV